MLRLRFALSICLIALLGCGSNDGDDGGSDSGGADTGGSNVGGTSDGASGEHSAGSGGSGGSNDSGGSAGSNDSGGSGGLNEGGDAGNGGSNETGGASGSGGSNEGGMGGNADGGSSGNGGAGGASGGSGGSVGNGGTGGTDPGQQYCDDKTQEPIPYNLQDDFVPYLYFGDTADVTRDDQTSCDGEAAPDATIFGCSAWEYSATTGDHGGVAWSYPLNDFTGTMPGLCVSSDATVVEFYVRGAAGGEKILFGAGGGPRSVLTLTSGWTKHTVDLPSPPNTDTPGGVKEGFVWSATAADNPGGLRFYVGNITMKGGSGPQGCSDNTDCPLGQVCDVDTCVDGCGPPGGGVYDGDYERCPVGTACVPYSCDVDDQNCSFRCDALCHTWDCQSDADNTYWCWGRTPDVMACMLECQFDYDCPDGEECLDHSSNPEGTNGVNLGFCGPSPPCTTDDDCMTMHSPGMAIAGYIDCTCQAPGLPGAGHCLYNPTEFGGQACKYTAPP
jgi:hypothetical protein